MSLYVLILLCVVQGLTEFLPISSSGHLLLIEQVFGVSGNLLFLNLFLHVATLCAVVVVYRKTIIKLLKNPFQKYTKNLLLATLTTFVFAVGYKAFNFDGFVQRIYCFGFLLTSIILLACHYFQKKAIVFSAEELNTKNAIIVGAVQGLAVIPGLSRSGSTISSLIFQGVSQSKAAEFSFLMSMPIIVGGFAFELINLLKNPTNNYVFDIKIYIFAFFLTFFVSILALKATIKLLRDKKLIIFSVYTFVLFVISFVLNFVI